MRSPHFLEPLGNGYPVMESKSQNNGFLYTSFFRGLLDIWEQRFYFMEYFNSALFKFLTFTQNFATSNTITPSLQYT